MNTPLYLLRVVQLGLGLDDLDRMDFGLIMDMLTEAGNDDAEYHQMATQEDFDRF